MSTTGSWAATGAVLGLAIVLLLQQFGWISLSELVPSAEWLLGAAVVAGVVLGVLGWASSRRSRGAEAPVGHGSD